MRKIFINLPVENTEKAMQFYSKLGFNNYALFTDEHQKCMTWTEQIYIMLIAKEKFNIYSKRSENESIKSLDAYFTLPVESIGVLNEMVNAALKAGGTTPVPMVDEGFMQIQKIVDIDGHVWDIIYLDMAKFEQLKAFE